MKTNNEVTFQDLIDKIRSDLFSPFDKTLLEKNKTIPLFFVTQAEVEISFEISRDVNGEIKVSIPTILELGGGAKSGTTNSHKIKITLEPIVTAEEMRTMIDKETMKGIKSATQIALKKGITINEE